MMTHASGSGSTGLFDRVVLAHPRTVLLCLTAVIALLGVQARHFRLDASTDTLLLEGDEDLHYAQQIDTRYGGQELLVLTYTPSGGVFSPASLATLGKLRDDLRRLERVSDVQTILDVPLLDGPATSVDELTSELPTLESGKVALAVATESLRNSRLYRNLLLSPDARTTALIIKFSRNEDHEDLVKRRDELRRMRRQGELDDTGLAELKIAAEQLRQSRDVIAQNSFSSAAVCSH